MVGVGRGPRAGDWKVMEAERTYRIECNMDYTSQGHARPDRNVLSKKYNYEASISLYLANERDSYAAAQRNGRGAYKRTRAKKKRQRWAGLSCTLVLDGRPRWTGPTGRVDQAGVTGQQAGWQARQAGAKKRTEGTKSRLSTRLH